MANIVINEISDNYTYNIGNNSFATVALPITASWGPAFVDPTTVGLTQDDAGFTAELQATKWTHFPATRQGLDAFISTYRGAASLYKAHKDYSYQEAVTLLASGYDVLVCRVCSGTKAIGYLKVNGSSETYAPTDWNGFIITAKYPGTFGNSLRVTISKQTAGTLNYWNAVVYVADTTGGISAVENINFVIAEPVTGELPEYIVPIEEIDSKFITVATQGLDDTSAFTTGTSGSATFTGGADDMAASTTTVTPGEGEDAQALRERTDAAVLAKIRYNKAGYQTEGSGVTPPVYYSKLNAYPVTATDVTPLQYIKHMEWNYTAAYYVYSLLYDKLQYNPQRIVSPGWDDQNIEKLDGSVFSTSVGFVVSPLHKAIMYAAYYGRCGAGLLDIPISVPQSRVYNTTAGQLGYAQTLSQLTLDNTVYDQNAGLFNTHSALFAPWGQYKFIGVNRMTKASPSFLALLIQRAQILNQPIQYEWALPTDRKHNLNIGKMDYEVNKFTLDKWQKLDGVGVNVITPIPGLGTNLWGNSTLFDVPPATYQALANLSTRFLMNAVENVAYTVGLTITFQYNNDQAYSTFYAGVTPILDSMKNVGAIIDYRIQMSADINGLDYVNANSVVGKIYMTVAGVINDITVDLIALPQNVDLNSYVG